MPLPAPGQHADSMSLFGQGRDQAMTNETRAANYANVQFLIQSVANTLHLYAVYHPLRTVLFTVLLYGSTMLFKLLVFFQQYHQVVQRRNGLDVYLQSLGDRN